MVNIFIVEDDSSLRMLYEKALALNGYNILESARDGQEAVQKYEAFKEKPDIIIMDHRMPIKNGIEATKEILNNSSEIKPKVIFASADNSIKEMALQIGVKSFKSKPFTFQRLFDNIKKVLIMD
jgi:two-component system chemotaxis response regulator CheY